MFFSINWSSFFALCLDTEGWILSLPACSCSKLTFRVMSIFVVIAAVELKQDYLVSELWLLPFGRKVSEAWKADLNILRELYKDFK